MNNIFSFFCHFRHTFNRTPNMLIGIAVLFCGFVLNACAPLHPPVTDLSPKLSFRSLGSVSAGSIVSWAPGGDRLAVNDAGLTLVDLKTAKRWRLDDKKDITALVWSPDGEYVAYAIPENSGSLLRIVDLKGDLLSELQIDGVCQQLYWPDTERLLASFMVIKRFRFGSNFRAGYIMWDTNHFTEKVKLLDVTLKPSTPVDPHILHRLFSFDLSPWGDEIIYSALYDPPLFATYSILKYRHLESGNEINIAKQPLDVAGGVFKADGDHVLYPDGSNNIATFAIWGQASKDANQSTGTRIVVPSFGPWRIVDATLYKDELPHGQISMTALAEFSENGNRLAIIENGKLFVVEGLTVPEKVIPSVDVMKKIRVLRDLRGKRLITFAEYRQRLMRLEIK